MAARNREIHPASSSDNKSSSHSPSEIEEIERRMEAYDSDSGSGSESEGDNHESKPVTNFDDLPTDDSEEDSESNDQDDSDGRSGDDDDDEEDKQNEDLPLFERVASQALMGRRYYTDVQVSVDDYGKLQRAERKSRAIELASERLKEARKSKSSTRIAGSKTGGNKKPNITSESHSSDDSSIEQRPATKRKKSKHTPTEMSSKRRDFFSRGKPDLNSSGIGVSIGANKYKPRDPRMVSLSGHLDADLFEKRYNFLNEVQEKEIEVLKQRVTAWKTSGKRGQKARRKLGMTQGSGSLENDQDELKRLLQERAERKRSQVAIAAKRSVKKKIRQDVASGKRGAYYPKRNEMRRMEMEAKFEEIRKRGGDEAVDKAIAKRRKKNMSKNNRLMPSHMVS